MKDYIIGERQKSYGKVWRILAIGLIVMALGASLVLREAYSRALQPVSQSQHSIVLTIPPGSTISEISTLLKESGLIREAWAFEWYVRNNNVRDKLQAGTYTLRPNQGVASIVGVITNGKVSTDLFTILPAQRLDQIQSALINNGGFSPDDVSAALNPDSYSGHPALADLPAGASLEGYIYPESFQIDSTSSPQDVVRGALDEMAKRLTPDFKARVEKHGLTTHEAVILASIVENEVGDAEDRKTVAQVFMLRLQNNIKLESDITVLYGALRDGQPADLTYDSPFNTFNNAGLTPAPISNVSESSLEAVANPTDTDYLYFVAGDDGKTYFSHTLAEHEQLTAQHCIKLCGRD